MSIEENSTMFNFLLYPVFPNCVNDQQNAYVRINFVRVKGGTT